MEGNVKGSACKPSMALEPVVRAGAGIQPLNVPAIMKTNIILVINIVLRITTAAPES
jgi:hypothetical protein